MTLRRVPSARSVRCDVSTLRRDIPGALLGRQVSFSQVARLPTAAALERGSCGRKGPGAGTLRRHLRPPLPWSRLQAAASPSPRVPSPRSIPDASSCPCPGGPWTLTARFRILPTGVLHFAILHPASRVLHPAPAPCSLLSALRLPHTGSSIRRAAQVLPHRVCPMTRPCTRVVDSRDATSAACVELLLVPAVNMACSSSSLRPALRHRILPRAQKNPARRTCGAAWAQASAAIGHLGRRMILSANRRCISPHPLDSEPWNPAWSANRASSSHAMTSRRPSRYPPR